MNSPHRTWLHVALAVTVATETAGATEKRLLEEVVRRGLVPSSDS